MVSLLLNNNTIIKELLSQDDHCPDLCNFAEKCMTTNYFFFNFLFHKQTYGTLMGPPLPSMVANRFMMIFEIVVPIFMLQT